MTSVYLSSVPISNGIGVAVLEHHFLAMTPPGKSSSHTIRFFHHSGSSFTVRSLYTVKVQPTKFKVISYVLYYSRWWSIVWWLKGVRGSNISCALLICVESRDTTARGCCIHRGILIRLALNPIYLRHSGNQIPHLCFFSSEW